MPVNTSVFVSLLFATVLAAACGGGAMPEETMTTPADPAPINEVRSQYEAAFNAGDTAGIAALFAEDAVSLPDHRSAAEGRAAIQQDLQGVFDQYTTNITITPLDTEISGDLAHEHGTFEITLTPKAGGEAMMDDGKYLVILKREADGSWKLHHTIHNSNNPPPGMSSQEDVG